MSANETFDTYYAETAYIPEKRREWEAENPKRDKMFSSRLPWNRKTQDSGNEFLYDFKWLVTSQEFEERRKENGLQGQHIFNELKSRLDHQALMPPNHTALAKFFFMSMAIGKGFFYLCLFVQSVVMVMTIGYIPFSEESTLETLYIMWDYFLFLAPFIVIFFLTWKTLELLSKKRPDIAMGMRKGPIWEANRQTGMLTFYKKKRAWKQRLQAPFHEFDAFLQSSPDSQGSSTYSLILYHPQQRIKQKLDAFFPPTKMDGDLVAAWQFLQRYMDVSQPLPDVPGLEIHRHKDPTTAASDKRKKRNPHYWRDMSEQSVRKIQREKYLKNIRR